MNEETRNQFVELFKSLKGKKGLIAQGNMMQAMAKMKGLDLVVEYIDKDPNYITKLDFLRVQG